MSIVNFTVEYDLLAAVPDSSDSGVDVDLQPLMGEVDFTAQFVDNKAIQAPGYSPRPTGFKILTFTGYIDSDGRLKSSRGGTVGVRLPANDPEWGLERLVYKVDFRLSTTPAGEPIRIDSDYFEAPSTDITLNLANLLTPTGSPTSPINLPAVVSAAQEAAQVVVSAAEAAAQTAVENYLDSYNFSTARPDIYHVDDYGADPTGAADSKAAVIAAYNALDGQPGIIEFGCGIYRIGGGTLGTTQNDAAGLNEAAGRLLKPGQGIRGQGVGQTTIDYRGTGAAFEFRDRNFDDTSSNVIHHHGGCTGLNILGWFNNNNNTCGIRFGDQSRMYINDVEVAGFGRPGGKGLWGDNQYRWSERNNITMTIARCTDNVLFEAVTGNQLFPAGSFDYSQYWFAFSVGQNMNGFTLRSTGISENNKASMNGCKLTIVGNASVTSSPSTPNSGVLLTFGATNDDTARFTGELYVNVETSGTAGGKAHKDINQGTGPFDQIQSRVAATGSINLIPIAGSNFQAGSADRRTFAFAGLLKNVSCFGSTGANNAFQSLNLLAQTRGSQYQENTDAIQHVYVTGATGGTFTLTFNGQTTTPLSYNATPAQVQSALIALSTIGSGNITVADTKARFINGVLQDETGYELVFGGTLSQVVVPLVTADGANLTGDSPSVTAVERRPGSPNKTYVLLLEGGSIFYVDPPAGTYRMRYEVTGLTSMGNPALGGDSPFGLNTVDIWIKQPEVGNPVIFEGPWFAPRKGSGSTASFRWIDGQEPTLLTAPGSFELIRLSSYNFGVWIGEHVTRQSTTRVPPPATASSPGVKGQIAHDTNYIYTCVATNTWKRSLLSAW